MVEAVDILILEVELRLSPAYLNFVSSYIDQNKTPPIKKDLIVQKYALSKLGYSDDQRSVDQYRDMIIRMP